jgi:hypothetical protein
MSDSDGGALAPPPAAPRFIGPDRGVALPESHWTVTPTPADEGLIRLLQYPVEVSHLGEGVLHRDRVLKPGGNLGKALRR